MIAPAPSAPPQPPETMATVRSVTDQASGLAHDLITLAELQVRLLYSDLRAAWRRSAVSTVALGAMGAMLLGAVPVLLFGVAHLLSDGLDWNYGVACLMVGGVAGLGAAVAGWIGARRLAKVMKVFSRTHQEFYSNLEFLKAMLRGDDPRRTFH